MTAVTTVTDSEREAARIVWDAAGEFLETLEGTLKLTKDHYGDVMSFISRLDGHVQRPFLAALVGHGYPRGTAAELAGIFGFDDLRSKIERMG